MSDPKTDTLSCNKCWSPLTEPSAVLTSCCHVFCTRCATATFNFQSVLKCPACHQQLQRDTDLEQLNLDPSKVRRALYGLSPTAILEIAHASCGFWEYHRRVHLQRLLRDSSTTSVGAEELAAAQQELSQARAELSAQGERLGALEKDCALKTREVHRLETDLEETSRAKRRYQKLYESASAAATEATSSGPSRSRAPSTSRGSGSVGDRSTVPSPRGSPRAAATAGTVTGGGPNDLYSVPTGAAVVGYYPPTPSQARHDQGLGQGNSQYRRDRERDTSYDPHGRYPPQHLRTPAPGSSSAAPIGAAVGGSFQQAQQQQHAPSSPAFGSAAVPTAAGVGRARGFLYRPQGSVTATPGGPGTSSADHPYHLQGQGRQPVYAQTPGPGSGSALYSRFHGTIGGATAVAATPGPGYRAYGGSYGRAEKTTAVSIGPGTGSSVGGPRAGVVPMTPRHGPSSGSFLSRPTPAPHGHAAAPAAGGGVSSTPGYGFRGSASSGGGLFAQRAVTYPVAGSSDGSSSSSASGGDGRTAQGFLTGHASGSRLFQATGRRAGGDSGATEVGME